MASGGRTFSPEEIHDILDHEPSDNSMITRTPSPPPLSSPIYTPNPQQSTTHNPQLPSIPIVSTSQIPTSSVSQQCCLLF